MSRVEHPQGMAAFLIDLALNPKLQEQIGAAGQGQDPRKRLVALFMEQGLAAQDAEILARAWIEANSKESTPGGMRTRLRNRLREETSFQILGDSFTNVYQVIGNAYLDDLTGPYGAIDGLTVELVHTDTGEKKVGTITGTVEAFDSDTPPQESDKK